MSVYNLDLSQATINKEVLVNNIGLKPNNTGSNCSTTFRSVRAKHDFGAYLSGDYDGDLEFERFNGSFRTAVLKDASNGKKIFAARFPYSPNNVKQGFWKKDLDQATGLQEEFEPSLSVYPNPIGLGEILNIELPLTKVQNVSVQVYDLTGKQLAQVYQGELSIGVNLLDFNTSSLSNGVYLLKISQGEKVLTHKFIID